MHLLLIGNYGVANTGDEALREYFLARFPEVTWTVVSANPTRANEVPRFPVGFRSFFKTNWIQFLRALRACDGVVFGGGSLFTDVESPFACLLWGVHARVAWLYRKPIYFAFQGIGPFKTRQGKLRAKKALHLGSFLSVRDVESYKRASQLLKKSKIKNIVQSFDPIFSMIEDKKSEDRTHELLSIIPRKNSPELFLDRASGLVMDGDFGSCSIVSMQPDDADEEAVCLKLRERVGGEIVIARTMEELCIAIQSSARVLTERYHGALAAFALRIPVYIQWQEEGDKLHTLSQFLADGDIEQKANEARELVKKGEDALRTALKN